MLNYFLSDEYLTLRLHIEHNYLFSLIRENKYIILNTQSLEIQLNCVKWANKNQKKKIGTTKSKMTI